MNVPEKMASFRREERKSMQTTITPIESVIASAVQAAMPKISVSGWSLRM